MYPRLLKNIVLPLTLLLSLSAIAVAADKYELKVVTDRPDAIYKTGETAKFLVSVTKNGKLSSGYTVTYFVDDFITGASGFPEGTMTLGKKPILPVPVTSDKPIFLRCVVKAGAPVNQTKIAAVGFSPEEIQLSQPVPADFDEFWADQKKQLAQVPAKAKLTAVNSPDAKVETFDVQVDCLGGAPVSGYFGKPKGSHALPLPAILWVHGAGVRSSSLANAVKGAKFGMLSMDINAHGLPNGNTAQYYSDLAQGKLKGYRQEGRESRETVYFRGMFLRLVRAIDFLTSQPEWDGKTLIVIGHSQGGGQALAAGGLDERVTFIATGVPAICDHSGRAAGRINGWPKLVETGANGKPDPPQLQAAAYVDAVNFTTRAKADAIMSVGFIDAVCPPSSCYAAYNQLKGKKQIINKPLMGHAAPADIQKAFFDAVLEHVKEQADK
ncbi:Acetyl esterase Axe7A precursor [Gimesia maris]|uniref:acetylxylan esterase n=1 Tax=Gimesia maris TaxID=122 RepID=UPI001187FCE2|nr:acetylxylan esterase [Gimesia maris]QDU17037.1 Acetyl esterase Axe7A precursor [Gimesia maris]